MLPIVIAATLLMLLGWMYYWDIPVQRPGKLSHRTRNGSGKNDNSGANSHPLSTAGLSASAASFIDDQRRRIEEELRTEAARGGGGDNIGPLVDRSLPSTNTLSRSPPPTQSSLPFTYSPSNRAGVNNGSVPPIGVYKLPAATASDYERVQAELIDSTHAKNRVLSAAECSEPAAAPIPLIDLSQPIVSRKTLRQRRIDASWDTGAHAEDSYWLDMVGEFPDVAKSLGMNRTQSAPLDDGGDTQRAAQPPRRLPYWQQMSDRPPQLPSALPLLPPQK